MSPEHNIVGSVHISAIHYVPRNFDPCDGRLLSPQIYAPLYGVLGTTYGGDGRNTFGLPDYRCRALAGSGHGPDAIPITPGLNRGVQSVQIQLPDEALPAHTHHASIDTDRLNGSVETRVNLQSATITGRVRCNILEGDNVDPAGKYPGAPANQSIGVWSLSNNNRTMASDLLSATISEKDLPLITSSTLAAEE